MSKESEGVIDDNGHKPDEAKEILTPEGIKRNKIDAFNKNPDDFVKVTDLTLGAMKNKLGLWETLVGEANRIDLTIAIGLLEQDVQERITYLKLLSRQNNKIITDVANKTGFRNFLNRKR